MSAATAAAHGAGRQASRQAGEAGEAGAGRCLGPTSSRSTHHQQAESRVGHQLHGHGLRFPCTVSSPGPWMTARHPQIPTANKPEIQTQGAKDSR